MQKIYSNHKIKFLLIAILSCFTLKGICQPSISYSNSTLTYTVGSHIAPVFPVVSGTSLPYAYGQTMTIAGSGVSGYLNGTGTAAKFALPTAVVTDASGNVYVSDGNNGSIREVSPAGVVTAFSGYGTGGYVDGSATTAKFARPLGASFDGSGNLYIADNYNNVIRMVNSAGTASTYAGNGTAGYADGQVASAEFNHPTGTAVDAAGNVYVSDNYNNVIRKITPAGVVSTFAGSGTQGDDDGVGTAAQFNNPQQLTIDASGNLYVADKNNNVVRKITPAGVVSTYAADGYEALVNGDSPTASFFYPVSVAMDATGNMYVADQYYSIIRKITPGGVVSTLAGSKTVGSADGIGVAASFNAPNGVAVDATGNVYVADGGNNTIRKVITGAYSISPALPAGLVFDRATGGISGVPTVTSPTTTYTIRAVNGQGTSNPTTISLAVNPQSNFNPSQNQNYITTFTPREAGLTNNALLATASADKNNVEIAIQYMDGLGRPIQTVQVKGSPTGADVVQPMAYDQFGREPVKYLPYAVAPTTASDGSYKPTTLSDQPAFYSAPPAGVSIIATPQAATAFEPSPLNRVVEQGAPGDAWQLTGTIVTTPNTTSGHTVKTIYSSNDNVNYSAQLYEVNIDASGNRTLINQGLYGANQLYVTVDQDENWSAAQTIPNTANDPRLHTTEEYKDKEGHIVLKRTYNYTTAIQVLSTYYVYDDYGNLAFVLPPLSGADSATPNQTILDNLCYQYNYDNRNRLMTKKIPGKGLEEMVYNQLDQLLYDRDANKKALGEWGYTKYDGQGRVIMTGITIDTSSRAPLQSYVTNMITLTDTVSQWEAPVTTNGIQGYSDTAFPWGNNQIPLVVNYYDNYTFPGQPSTVVVPANASVMTRSLPTATKTAVLNTVSTPATTPDMLWTVHYYDDLGRATQTYSQHYLGGILSVNNYDVITTAYSFTNLPLTTTRVHSIHAIGNKTTIANQYVYDHMDRKVGTWEQLTYSPGIATSRTLISNIVYNELGQVMTKNLNSLDSATYSQNIAYNYNERGWLLGSSAQLFQMQLQYNNVNNVTGIAPTAQYNGNIASQSWGTGTAPNANSYTYTYDQLNRLTSGNGTINNNENNITYDLNGNISTLNRYQNQVNNGNPIDQLSYTYNNTNQLQSVADNSGYFGTTDLVNGTTNYTYDNNGNVLSNSNSTNTAQNKSYTYNMLNLPQSVTIPTGTVTYTYDANGRKLRKVKVINGTTTTTDYIDGIEYDNGTTYIGFIQTEEGKVVPTSTTNNYMSYDYYYYLSDNLGNTRVTFDAKNGLVTTLQTDDYYPFGLEINGLVNSPKNEYLYNKKELQEELGQYDYGARFYDPVIARWTTMDPLVEISRKWSPYNYVMNNPIRLIDPDGMAATDQTAQADQAEEFKQSVAKFDQQQATDQAALKGDKSSDGANKDNSCCGTTPGQAQQDQTSTTKKKAGANGIATGPYVIIDGKKVYINYISKGPKVNGGQITLTAVRNLSHAEAMDFLNKEMDAITATNDYGTNIGFWGFSSAVPSLLGAPQVAPVVTGQVMTLTHNLTVLGTELQRSYDRINHTDLGLIEITTTTLTGNYSAIDGGGQNISGYTATSYYIPNGELVTTATTNGN